LNRCPLRSFRETPTAFANFSNLNDHLPSPRRSTGIRIDGPLCVGNDAWGIGDFLIMVTVRDRFFILFGCSEREYSWRGIGLLLVVYFSAIFVAAVLSPLIYDGFLWWARTDPNDVNAFFARKPFPRYVDRLRWITTLALLPWVLKTCGLLSAEQLGLPLAASRARRIVIWFGIGLILPALVAAFQIAVLTPNVAWAFSPLRILKILAVALLAAGLLGLFEETVFRGVLLRVFYTAMRPSRAVIAASLVFAALHFKKIPEGVWTRGEAVDFSTGFEVGLWTVLGICQAFDPIMFLNLFLSGFVLSLVFLKTGSLWPCIGLHGGWVFYRAVYSRCVDIPILDSNVFLGSEKIIDGLAAAVLLAAMAGILICRPNRQPVDSVD